MKHLQAIQTGQISNRFHHQSPYQSHFQYPPIICNIQNPNMSPALKALINNSPTLKALSKSFLPSISNNKPEDLYEIEDDPSHNNLLDTIFESNKPKDLSNREQPFMKENKKKLNCQVTKLPEIKPTPRSQRSQTESPGLNRSSRKNLPKTVKTTQNIKQPKKKSKININQQEHRSNEESHREAYMQKYVNDHSRTLSSSRQSRDLESELSERICSSKASCRSNNSKNMDLRFGSLLSEDGNYAMLKTYEDMIYEELVTLYPQLIKPQMYRTNTNDFRNFPTKLSNSKVSKLPIITESRLQKKVLKAEFENLEVTMHKSSISRYLDQAMKIYDAIKLMKGQLTTYGNNFNFKNERYLLNAFIDWKNSWHNV